MRFATGVLFVLVCQSLVPADSVSIRTNYYDVSGDSLSAIRDDIVQRRPWKEERDAETRWTIEDYHKCWKTGCRVENRQYMTAQALERSAALSAVVAVRLASLRYESGFSAYFEVLDAQELLFTAETSAAQIRRDRLIALVDLYRALGGGWQER